MIQLRNINGLIPIWLEVAVSQKSGQHDLRLVDEQGQALISKTVPLGAMLSNNRIVAVNSGEFHFVPEAGRLWIREVFGGQWSVLWIELSELRSDADRLS